MYMYKLESRWGGGDIYICSELQGEDTSITKIRNNVLQDTTRYLKDLTLLSRDHSYTMSILEGVERTWHMSKYSKKIPWEFPVLEQWQCASR